MEPWPSEEREFAERYNGELAGVVLAAGIGARLRPLTDLRPKALCPLANVPMLEYSVRRAWRFTADVAVNVHAHPDKMLPYLSRFPSLSVSLEPERPLGTAGALGRLKEWIDQRAVLVQNVDSWHTADLSAMLEAWDGETIRLLVKEEGTRADFGSMRYIGACVMPWRDVVTLSDEPNGLYEACWKKAELENRLEFVTYTGTWFDCGTPRNYLMANLHRSGGETVVGMNSVIEGEALRCVVWPDAHVRKGEQLFESIRATAGITVNTYR